VLVETGLEPGPAFDNRRIALPLDVVGLMKNVRQGSAMKTHRSFDAGLPEWLTPHLDLYCSRARETLRRRSNGSPMPGEDAFWLGAEGEAMTGKAISRKLRQIINRHLGRAMSLHLFRDGATTTLAVEAGADIGVAGDVLGHADPKTAERYYNQARGVEASRRYQDLLEGLRRGE